MATRALIVQHHLCKRLRFYPVTQRGSDSSRRRDCAAFQDAYWREAGEGQKSKSAKKKEDDDARKCGPRESPAELALYSTRRRRSSVGADGYIRYAAGKKLQRRSSRPSASLSKRRRRWPLCAPSPSILVPDRPAIVIDAASARQRQRAATTPRFASIHVACAHSSPSRCIAVVQGQGRQGRRPEGDRPPARRREGGREEEAGGGRRPESPRLPQGGTRRHARPPLPTPPPPHSPTPPPRPHPYAPATLRRWTRRATTPS